MRTRAKDGRADHMPENNIAPWQRCLKTADELYKEEKFSEIIKLYNDAPPDVAKHPKSKLIQLEALRKMKRYDEVIEMADDFIDRYSDPSNKNQKDYENVIRAKAIKGFALKDSGKTAEASLLFYELMEEYMRGVHRARILCGYTFSTPGFSPDTAAGVIEELEGLLEMARGEGIRRDIKNALERLYYINSRRTSIAADVKNCLNNGKWVNIIKLLTDDSTMQDTAFAVMNAAMEGQNIEPLVQTLKNTKKEYPRRYVDIDYLNEECQYATYSVGIATSAESLTREYAIKALTYYYLNTEQYKEVVCLLKEGDSNTPPSSYPMSDFVDDTDDKEYVLEVIRETINRLEEVLDTAERYYHLPWRTCEEGYRKVAELYRKAGDCVAVERCLKRAENIQCRINARYLHEANVLELEADNLCPCDQRRDRFKKAAELYRKAGWEEDARRCLQKAAMEETKCEEGLSDAVAKKKNALKPENLEPEDNNYLVAEFRKFFEEKSSRIDYICSAINDD
ncbi:MAG: hypothetical protein QW171_02165 [Candidatus Bilamarchaeaceae archaeon]